MTDHDYSSFLPEITKEELLYYRNQQRIADKIFRNRPGQDRKLFNKNEHHFIDNPMDKYPTKNYNGEHDKEHKKIITEVLDNSGSVFIWFINNFLLLNNNHNIIIESSFLSKSMTIKTIINS